MRRVKRGGLYDTARNEFRPLGLSTRVINALVASGISSIHELHALSESELEQVRGIGPTAIGHLRPFLCRQTASFDVNPTLLSVKFADAKLGEIDKWALQQKGVVSRAEAIRRLVELALKRDGE